MREKFWIKEARIRKKSEMEINLFNTLKCKKDTFSECTCGLMLELKKVTKDTGRILKLHSPEFDAAYIHYTSLK